MCLHLVYLFFFIALSEEIEQMNEHSIKKSIAHNKTPNNAYNKKINITGTNNKTPLHIAAEKGYETTIKLLLSKNLNIDQKDFNNNGPIHYAVYNGKLNSVKILLDHGSNIDSVGEFGDTPLHIAVKKGFENIVNLLLSRKASVNIKNQKRMTPLHLSIIHKNLNITKTLISHGGDLNISGNKRITPLMYAALNGDENIVNLIISKNNLQLKDDFKNEAIHYAALSGSIKVLNILLDHGADPNSKGLNGKTPLSFGLWGSNEYFKKSLNKIITNSRQIYALVKASLERNLVDIMNSLIQHGADVNLRNFLDQTVLHEAAAFGNVGIVEFLLLKNANLFIQDNVCFTPIHWAANNGQYEVINTLLKHGDDVNRKGCNNITTLHLAIRRNDMKLIEFLLSKNGDPNAMSEDGRTPLDLAFQSSSEEILTLLLKHGAKLENNNFLGSKVLFDAVAKKSLDVMYVLLDSVSNIDTYPTVLLNYAIRNDFFDGVHLLVSSGANIQQKDIHGYLPLSSAVISKNKDLVKLILKTAAFQMSKTDFQTFIDAECDVKFEDVNFKKIVEFRKFTALHTACEFGLADIVKLLISYDATIEVKDVQGYTPLHRSCKKGHVEVVKLLLDSGAFKDPLSFNGTTPLQIACRLNHFAIVELLLSDPSAAINLADNNGYTPLHYAAMTEDSYGVVRYLLDRGAYRDSRTIDLKTPLHIASIAGQKVAVEILLRSGAEEDASDVEGMTPLHFAVREGHHKIVNSMLKSGAFVNSRNINGSTPLHLACASKIKFEDPFVNVIVSSLLVYGANVGSIDNDHMTPLHVAAAGNSFETLKFLLSYKADLSSRDMWLNQPIHYAALKGNYDILLEMLNDHKGITLAMSVNEDNETPLFLAAREGHADVVALLLRAGVEGLQPDFEGRTALHRSACRGHLGVVRILRQALLNKENEDKWGFTALNYAASWKGHQEVIGYLLTTQLDLTMSYYLNISNPHKQYHVIPKLTRAPKFLGTKVGIPYYFTAYFDNIYNLYV